jgi:predicted SprT family Zn-dependent metalloprotease
MKKELLVACSCGFENKISKNKKKFKKGKVAFFCDACGLKLHFTAIKETSLTDLDHVSKARKKPFEVIFVHCPADEEDCGYVARILDKKGFKKGKKDYICGNCGDSLDPHDSVVLSEEYVKSIPVEQIIDAVE